MDKLWAPWRMEYIRGIHQKDHGCIFCEKTRGDNDRENLILFRGKKNFIIMNRYPYNNGHLMVVPFEHSSDSSDLKDAAILEIWRLTNKCKEVLTKSFHPDGFNIGMNIGRTAGAGIDQHIHMHIVPRWNGDTNYMPVIGETKVISQGLLEAYDIMKPYFTANPAKLDKSL